MIEIVIVLVLFLILMCFIRSDNTYRTRRIISQAIVNYSIHCYTIKVAPEVSHKDMEPYDQTLYRLYDWGYENILPKDKYDIVKGFIEKI